YLEQVVQNLIQQYPQIDGIHWDYIRYAGEDYGYNQVSVERFNRANGRPLDSRPAPSDAAWSQWRRDRVSETARRLYIRAKALNPRIQVSAATITWGASAATTMAIGRIRRPTAKFPRLEGVARGRHPRFRRADALFCGR
ncbi:family 10 glycosylhydrolase, partial [Candidatus Gracilibacteria bacterium]|nr:family 10 glycosylhydrolase [Candidatus Gracilibacteria bacterium]